MTNTAKQARHSQFKRGQGVYACRCCERNTRDTGDNGSVELCSECYDLAGEENHMSDNGGALYDSPARVLEMIATVAKLGGNASKWDTLKARALELLPASLPASLPAPASGKPVATPRLDDSVDRTVYETAVKFGRTIQSPANRKFFAAMVDSACHNANLTILTEKARPAAEWADQFKADIQLYLDTFGNDFHGTIGQLNFTVRTLAAYFRKLGIVA